MWKKWQKKLLFCNHHIAARNWFSQESSVNELLSESLLGERIFIASKYFHTDCLLQRRKISLYSRKIWQTSPSLINVDLTNETTEYHEVGCNRSRKNTSPRWYHRKHAPPESVSKQSGKLKLSILQKMVFLYPLKMSTNEKEYKAKTLFQG